MSIDDLAAVSVTSVSKSAQPLANAPAAVYVISREAIQRSGTVTLPDMLRLAPNLQVYEVQPGHWMVTARGFNGNTNAQSFSNKLLVLLDGRTLYTPLYSGVYWDLPDVLPEDIDRIEVISGPGATLWGANAVNGVINIVTRSSAETVGTYAMVRAGANQPTAAARTGAFLTDRLSARLYARWQDTDSARKPAGTPAGDGQHRIGGGFRLDWDSGGGDRLSLAGEAFAGRLLLSPTADETTSGRNLALRWNHAASDGSELQAQVFYDRITRESHPGGHFYVDTWGGELQHGLQLGTRHRLLWGGGVRLAHYRIDGTPNLFFDPDRRDLFLANAFVQNSWTPLSRLGVIAGLKLEHDPYVGASLLPELRLSWKPRPTTLVWAAVSRAVRSPTPFDVDVEERVPGVTLSGNRLFRTEKLTAFELGLRMQPTPSLSFSLNGYYHQYDDLRTVEIVPNPPPGIILSLAWGNKLTGSSHGIDAWADWRLTPWWTLSAGGSWLAQDFHFAPGASGIIGTAQLGTDPAWTAKLRSSFNLGRHVRLDANVRAIGALKGSTIPGYRELGGRLAWFPSPKVVFSVSAENLLHSRHQEYPGGDLIPRHVLGGVELRF